MTELWKIYQEVGIAAFFAALYLATIAAYLFDLKKQREASNAAVERMISAMDSSTMAQSNSAEVLKQVKTSIDASIIQNVEFLAYLKGRDRRDD